MPLYGNELTAELTPFDAGLGRVVKFDKPGDFVGRAALAAARVLRPPRRSWSAWSAAAAASPARGTRCSAMGSLWEPSPPAPPPPRWASPSRSRLSKPGTDLSSGAFAVDVRGRAEAVEVVALPFYRRTS